MICFEIFVNGKRICLAGLASVDSGVLAAHLTSWQGPLEEGSTTERESQLHLFVAGCTDGKRFRWPEPNQTPLAVGDEVTFKVVEAVTPDEGVRHFPQNRTVNTGTLPNLTLQQNRICKSLHIHRLQQWQLQGINKQHNKALQPTDYSARYFSVSGSFRRAFVGG